MIGRSSASHAVFRDHPRIGLGLADHRIDRFAFVGRAAVEQVKQHRTEQVHVGRGADALARSGRGLR
jgi:hypothetical protein